MKRVANFLARKFPNLSGLAEREELISQIHAFRKRMQFAPGHFYSSIASTEDIDQHYAKIAESDIQQIPGIDLRTAEQLSVCERVAKHYHEHPFQDKPADSVRYYFDNQTFPCSDALFLYGMLRELKPKRIVEIGSGFSSAVMLDTVEQFIDTEVQLTFIEPYPDRLNDLLKDSDQENCTIIERRVQDVQDNPWDSLCENDILFIDSSHVSKCGSDVNMLFFEVLPALKKGVIVHIHDVFPNFEYPEEWLRMGRNWNEDYLTRAFLQFNNSFEILVWVPLMIESNASFFEQKMPICLRNSGGSLWMQRTA